MNRGVARKGDAFLWTGVMKTNPFLTTGHLPELAKQIQRSREGKAHFAGTGLFGATCGECAYLGYWRQRRNGNGEIVKTERVGGCEKFHQLTGKHGAAVPPATAACRHFERREPV
jgi:hypothetical protein